MKLLKLPFDLIEHTEVDPDVISIFEEVMEKGNTDLVRFLKALSYLEECFLDRYRTA